MSEPPPSLPAPSRVHRSAPMRWLYLVAGIVSLALGVVGIFVPVLPTTPFVLLAAACFARSSPRFHEWLLRHRVMGPIIREWEAHRAMPPGVKPWAYAVMAVTFGISIAVVPALWHRLMLLSMALILAFFIWRIPVRPR